MISDLPDPRLEIREGIGVLTFDRPASKVNLLTRDVMLRLYALLGSAEEAVGRGELRALVIRSGKAGNFIAGADLDELAALGSADAATELSRRGHEIFTRLERFPRPTLAAIDGACLGGGLELALACRHRVCSDHPGTRLGLPETRLGILPGLGGTVRLPRLIGLRAALDLILSARQIDAARAERLGLVDRVLSAASFEPEVRDLAAALARGETPLRRARRMPLARKLTEGAAARWLLTWRTSRWLRGRTRRHYPALPAALQVTVDGLALESQQAAEREAAAFGRLAVTAECKNLIAVFRMTEAARKRMPEGVAAPVKRAAVVGAGVMGAGIAELFAYQSIPVQVADVATDRVEAGLMRARELLEKAAEKAGWSSDERARRLACLRGSTEYAGFEKADLVVEAVPERADLKRDVMASIEKHVRSSTVIATNTSALSVSDLQHALAHPGRVCGLHFFNPPHRMPLVEVVRGTKTSNGALATAFEIALRLGKTPIVVRDAPGFAVNRVLSAYLTEAGHLLQQGMTLESVDAVMERFGMPLGPLRLLDEIGLDVAAEVIHTMHAAYGERFGPAAAVERVLASGASGRKGGRGFYRYAGAKAKGVNPEVRSLLRSAARGRPPTDAEAEERMVFSMVNEAARVLDDHIVDAPQSLDIAMIMGAGFPPFRGGLLRYADAVGLERIANRLEHYAGSVAPRFAPATGLLRRRAFYPGPEPGR